jgi:hypothetical protein
MEEQRSQIKFCIQASTSSPETPQMIQTAYGHSALSRFSIYQWYSCFCSGREDTKDDPSSGHTSTARINEKIEAASHQLIDEHCILLHMIAEHLNNGKDAIHMLVEKNLGKRKVCARFLPHTLTM